MKKILAKAIAKASGLDEKEIIKTIEIPPNSSLGDFAFPCFAIAKKEKKNPREIAQELKEKIGEINGFEKISVQGGYLNFFVSGELLMKEVFEKKKSPKKAGVVVIDMSSPNIAKPFGIGHLRSTIIGNSIAKILEANGYKTVKLNFLGDWGTQFGKLIFGFKKFGSMEKLKSNPIEHLYEIYIKSQKEEYEDEARKEFEKLEKKDSENLKLWKMFRDFSLKEFKEIYSLLGVDFDVWNYESDYREKAKAVVDELLKKKICKKDQGALIVDLKDENLGVVIIQKKDGTSLYITRDLAAAIDRKQKYDFDSMIYEVGSEQKLYFRQLFEILKRTGRKWAGSCEHVAHGLYLGKDGKRFATRKGKTISMKEILREVIEKAKKNLLEREKIPQKELEKRARAIAISAIFYGDLKNYRENNIVFDVDRFLDFEGDTGPYLLYSYARANSILRKTHQKRTKNSWKLEPLEKDLLKKILDFENVVKKAGEQRSPNLVANYSYELAKLFNEFYHSCPVLGNEKQDLRLEIVKSFKDTLKKSLELLGIPVLERM